MKSLIATITIALFTLNVFSQNVHLIYKTVFAGVKLEQDGRKDSKTSFIEGERHFLIFDEKKGISYFNADGKAFKNLKLYLSDKKKAQYKNIELSYQGDNKPYEYKSYKRIWKNTKKDIQNMMQQDSLKLEYSNETKTIKGYNCKLIYLIDRNYKTLVWYTEEFSYNWAMNDYHFLIPGTVVLVMGEQAEKPILELVEKKSFDISDTQISQENIDLIFKNWRKEY
jgi:GLPGLI family protein